jgi:hypothetical protein
MQQVVIVSTDTVPLLGTMAALLLFRQMLIRPSAAALAALFLVSAAVVLAKPPSYALILALPCWHVPWRRLCRWYYVLPGIAVLMLAAVGGFLLLWRVLDDVSSELGQSARLQLSYLGTAEGLSRFWKASLEYPGRFPFLESWSEPLGWLDTNLGTDHRVLLLSSFWLALIYDLVRCRLAWFQAVRDYAGPLTMSLIVVLMHALFAWLSFALVMYLTISDYQGQSITGMQMRYIFPIALMALLLSAAVIPPAAKGSPRRGSVSITAIGNSVMLAFALSRCIQLVADLQFRYAG